jgi:hypothetical protein
MPKKEEPPKKEERPHDENAPAIAFGVGVRAGFEEAHQKASLSTLNVRPYISGQLNRIVKFQANLDSDLVKIGSEPIEAIRILDAIGKFEIHDLFNIWAGRFLPPSDRANLSGPYFQSAWNFPVTSRYPSIYAGRDDGLAVWGQVDGGRFKYQLGGFSGGAPESLDAWRYAGRLTLNLLDPEPGYYNSSTYYGTKDVLAIGAVAQVQHDGIRTATGRDDLVAASGDLLFEKKLGDAGTMTIEGAYYDFEKAKLGSSFTVLGAYLIPVEVGIGRFQPLVRFQDYLVDNARLGGADRILDSAINYVISGHDARVSLNWTHEAPPHGASHVDSVQLGVQIQK